MTRQIVLKNDFTGGELDPALRGRSDLRAYAAAAAKLRNVIVAPTGGVTRRPGTRRIAELDGPAQLASLHTARHGAYLLVFSAGEMRVLQNEVEVARATLPSTAKIGALRFVQNGDELLITHPDMRPQRARRLSATSFDLTPWVFDDETLQPFGRHVDPGVQLSIGAPGALSPTTFAAPPKQGEYIRLFSSAPLFTGDSAGIVLRLKGRTLRITNPTGPTVADAQVLQDLVDTEPTTDWDEQAFSVVRGWPIAVTFFQGRLVIGGGRDLPDHVWLSKTGQPFNFDPGEGLDDAAIAFRLRAERGHTIRGLFAGRSLCVFTDHGEWVVGGYPVTPRSVQVTQQTRIGSFDAGALSPLDVDGAVLFVGADGKGLHEFLFTNTEQAWQANDLALLSRHLLNAPRALAFDRARRLLHVVCGDGTLASLTIERNAGVTAWSRQETSGAFRTALDHDGQIYLVVERQGHFGLERFAELYIDAAIEVTNPTPQSRFAGLDAYSGQLVRVFAGDKTLGDYLVQNGVLLVPFALTRLTLGLPYALEIEALPGAPGGGGAGFTAAYRPMQLSFQLLETVTLRVDTGNGARTLTGANDNAPFTGDIRLSTLGWRRGSQGATFRIVQDDAAPCTLLSVTLTAKVNV